MSQEPFGDIPLFREIQRLLSSSRGPVNLEIARQVALAVATRGEAEPPPDAALRRAFGEAVHRAEGLLSGFTRLPVEEPARVEILGRAEWTRATLEGWTWILEHLAHRFVAQLGGLVGEGADQTNPMQATLEQVGPLLSGMQAGTLVGQLAREVLARYDIPIPRSGERRLLLVAPNFDQAVADYRFERDDLIGWLALHEVARDLLTNSVKWLDSYFRSLLTEVVDALEIDPSDLERRFVELGSLGIEGIGEGASAGSVLPITPTERHRRAVRRLGSFLAVFEGYCSHAAEAVAGEMIAGRGRIEEGVARRRAASSEGRDVLAAVLGIGAERSQEAAGATFCAAVAKLKGLAALNRLWEAPDNLPDAGEIKDPFLWMERQSL
jgi:putative hydrolase